MTEAIRAGRILTMNPDRPEIIDGGLLVRAGRILAVGSWREVAGDGARRDLGAVTIVPGLVNAHAHLELSHLAGRLPTGLGFMGWADALFAAMREGRPDESSVERAVRQAKAGGTCCVADVVGREFDLVRRVLTRLGLEGFLVREYSGRSREFTPQPLSGLWSPGVHALYSTDRGFAQAVKRWCDDRGLPFSLHLAEVPGENELFLRGDGALAVFLRERRILPKGFCVPGMSAVGFAAELGLLNGRTLAVHCVQVTEDDMSVLAQSGVFVCLCPRSNRGIGVGDAPAAALRAAGIPLCLGTDSLASVRSLDLWDEARAVRSLLTPRTALGEVVSMMTLNPARVLGLDRDYGSLEVGKRAVWSVLPGDLEEW